MNVFDEIKEKLALQLSDWIEVEDSKNQWTIERFAKVNYDKTKIKPHCTKCTIVNQCWV